MSEFTIMGNLLTEYNGPGGDVCIPEGVMFVAPWTFNKHDNISSIEIPNSLVDIPKIQNNGKLHVFKEYRIRPNNPNFKAIDGVLFDKNVTTLISMPTGKTGIYKVPSGVLKIRGNSFAGSNLSNVYLPNGVTRIESYAFYDCPNLEKIILPDSLVYIGYGAFSFLSKLKSLTIPSKISKLKAGAIKYCENLRHISFKCDNIAFSSGTFLKLPNLNCIILSKDQNLSLQPYYKMPISIGIIRKKYNGETIDEDIWASVKKYVHYVKNRYDWAELIPHYKFLIPFLVDEKIMSEALMDKLIANANEAKNSELTSKLIDIKESLYPSNNLFERMMARINHEIKEAEKRAKYEEKLKDHNSKEYIKSVWQFSYYNGRDDEIIIKKYKGNDPHVVVPEYILGNKVTAISSYAFSSVKIRCGNRDFLDNELESVSFPNSIEHMGEGVFSFCRNLKSVKLPDKLMEIPNSFFYDCSNLQSINFGLGIKTIGKQAFSYCSSLKTIQFPDSLNTIADSAFYGCYGLTEITIPNSVTNIDCNAFYNCTGLQKVKLSKNMNELSFACFGGCTNLEELHMPFITEEIPFAAFMDCRNLKTFYLLPQMVSKMSKAYPSVTINTIHE